MKMKRFISAFAALAMSVSCFAGLAITANAAVGDTHTYFDVTFPTATYGADQDQTNTLINDSTNANYVSSGIAASTGLVFAGSGTRYNPYFENKNNVDYSRANAIAIGNNTAAITATLPDSANINPESDTVVVEYKMEFGKLSGKYVYANLYAADGSAIAEFSYNAYDNKFEKNTFNVSSDDFYHGNNWASLSRASTFTYTLDYKNGTATCAIKNYNATTPKTYTASLTSGENKQLDKVVFGSNYNNNARDCVLESLKITHTEIAPAEKKGYTIKYVDEEGNDIKDADTSRTGVVDSKISLLQTDTDPITKDDKKYVFKSSDLGEGDETKTITSDGQATVTLTFEEAAKFDVKAVAKIGSEEHSTLNSASVYDGNTFSYSYPKYLTDQNHKVIATTETPFSQTKTITAAETFDVVYTAYSNEHDVWCFEAEDIADLAANKIQSDGKASGGKKIYDYAGSEPICTVPESGTYTLTLSTNISYQTDLYKGTPNTEEKTNCILEHANGASGGVEKSVQNIKLLKGDVLYVVGSRKDANVDYILLEKTGDIPPTAEVKDEALFQPVNPATGEQETVSFDTLIGEDTLATKTIAVTIYDSADTKPTMSINGGTEFTPAWTAKTNETAGTRTFYAQFMAAEDDFDEFGTIVVKYNGTEVLSTTLVQNPPSAPDYDDWLG